MKLFKLALIAATLGLSVFAQAKNYGDAGCGLGTLVVGQDGNQILAATLNATGIQTFAITSGTSNCVDDGAVAANKEINLYIEVNKLALANDSAKGSGETVNGLAQLMKVNSSDLGQTLKDNYQDIFVDSNMDAQQIQSKIETHMLVM